MRFLARLFLLLTLATIACGSVPATNVPAALTPDSVSASTATLQTLVPENTFTPITAAAGVIVVDTLEQEVYPFMENGKCSLGEAIFAANSGLPKDSCAAGVIDQSVIELMPGEYHFKQRDQTPPQVEWMISAVSVGDALPPVIHSLTVHGNGAKLIRDESAEPFRFFELMFGTLTLQNLTVQGGDVQDDWGGAIYSMNSSLHLDNVHFLNNRAENGGAVYFTLGALTVQSNEFNGNHAMRGRAPFTLIPPGSPLSRPVLKGIARMEMAVPCMWIL